MHMAKGTIVSLFTVFSAYISSVQCREATSGNRVEEAGADLGGGDHIYMYVYTSLYTYWLCQVDERDCRVRNFHHTVCATWLY